jgi:hypothetical protein
MSKPILTLVVSHADNEIGSAVHFDGDDGVAVLAAAIATARLNLRSLTQRIEETLHNDGSFGLMVQREFMAGLQQQANGQSRTHAVIETKEN